ncbi:hypothetical protein ASG73_16360 [Janibacter sp. Soil728]|uniref:DUF6270 domain-containing protein n=1 Tax=Janibacter sp. Soil728 TaxID=1736393 RepID=UPI000701A8CE|nr:DUF6270 domain-containing protein [Janibacter sp. Soil728]KRE35507.1 hypothetical protein ASG73_16360 [Janibacter sp. Soil728]
MNLPRPADGWRPVGADYSKLDPVRVWSCLDDFVAGATLERGVDVIRLPSGDHLDVLVGGEPDAEGTCVPAFFGGAMPTRPQHTPPFFSGHNLGRRAGGRYLAFSDSLVAAEVDLTLGWYAGRAADRAQDAVATVLELAHQRWGRELLLVGGSGGGFAALEQLRRARVPTSAFVWNPQTDIQRYINTFADAYLRTALGLSQVALDRLSPEAKAERAGAAGIELAAAGRPIAAHGDGGRLLVLQNATDSHVADHMGPYLDRADLTDRGAGVYSDGRETWLIADMGNGHAVPPRQALEAGFLGMLREGGDSLRLAVDMRERRVAPLPPRAKMPVDLRGGEGNLLRAGLRVTQDACGVVRVWLGRPEQLTDPVRLKVQIRWTDRATWRDVAPSGLAALAPGAVAATVHLRDWFGHTVDSVTVPLEPSPGRGISVVGSCVSRDACEHLPPGISLVAYEARQSLISAFAPPVPLPPEHLRLTSPFQQRVFEADHASALPDRVRAMAPVSDLLAHDLVDERLGVFVHPDGGVTTRTVEWLALHTDGAPPHGARVVPFGSSEHLELFRSALVRWRALLEETGLLERTVLVAPPWATRTTVGKPTGESFGMDAGAGNAAMEPYVASVREIVGVDVVGSDLDTAAGESHRWGPAPFHYDDASERALAAALVERLPHPPALGGIVDEGDGIAVSVGPSGQGSLVVGVTLPPGDKVAFHLFRGAERVDMTGYDTTPGRSYWRLDPGRYIVRVFVLLPDGTRLSRASVGVNVG